MFPPMKSLYLVSCVSSKRDRPAPAHELYTSAWFQKARSYVETTGCPWFILSAEHGLLAPGEVVAPYEKTLNSMPINERRAWSRGVLQRLEEVVSHGDRVIFLAGARYREFLGEALTRMGVRVEAPLEGKRIGEQLQWLTEHAQHER